MGSNLISRSDAALYRMDEAALANQYGKIDGNTFNRFVKYLDVSEKTLETYTRNLKQFWRFLQERGIECPTRQDVIDYRDALLESGKKASTVQAYLVVVKLFFGWTELEGIYPDVAKRVKGAKVSREHKKDYLTSKQFGAVLGGIDRDSLEGKRDYAMILTMGICGLRTIEVSRANVEDLRPCGDSTRIYVQGKGRDDRAESVDVPMEVENAIRDYLRARGCGDGKAPLFAGIGNRNAGGRLTTKSISRIAKQKMKDVGLDSDRLTAHSLRHTAVTLALLAGDSIEQAQQFARHRNIDTTLVYAHHLDELNNTCARDVAQMVFA